MLTEPPLGPLLSRNGNRPSGVAAELADQVAYAQLDEISDHRDIVGRLPLRILEVLRAAGPLAVTSANRSGESPATTVDEAVDALGDAVDVYLGGGRCDGTPSTVVSLVGEPQILRSGALSREEIERVCSTVSRDTGGGS